MFSLDINGFEIVARTLVVYCLLLVALRLAGKREIGQMATFDLVVILLVSNAVQNAMVGPDVSVTGGLIAAGALIGGNYAVAATIERVDWLREAVEGTPTTLVSNGRFIQRNMRSEHITKGEVLTAIRERGIDRLEDVQRAELEIDGSISVIQTDANENIRRKRTRLPWRRGG